MLDQVIDVIYQVHDLNFQLQVSKKQFKIINQIRNKVTKGQKQHWDSVKIPDIQKPFETEQFEETVLKHICNLNLGEFNNAFKAKRRLVSGPILPANFDKDHLLTVLQNFKHELKGNILLLQFNLKKNLVFTQVGFDSLGTFARQSRRL